MHPSFNGDNSVAHKLIEYIGNEGLKSGDRLPPIRQLANQLKIGANSIRDALLQVQTMGLVKIQPRFGVFVQSGHFAPMVEAFADTLPPVLMQENHNLFHLVDTRSLIEIETAGLAAAHRRPEELLPLHQALENMAECENDHRGYTEADERFHLAIAGVAGNSVLLTVLRSVMTMLRPYKLKGFLPGPDLAYNRRSHETLYRAIWKGDVEGARAEMGCHLGHARKTLLRNIEKAAVGRRNKAAREKLAS